MADKPPVQKRKMVVIEEGTLTTMALNPSIAKAFPVLQAIAKLARGRSSSGCGSCGKASQERAKTFQHVKLSIASLDLASKRRLKDLMNAQQMRLLYKDAAGKPQQLTF